LQVSKWALQGFFKVNAEAQFSHELREWYDFFRAFRGSLGGPAL
jgi:hypothetical protein